MIRRALKAARGVANRCGFDVIRYRDPDAALPLDFDVETSATVRAVRPYTMAPAARTAVLCEATRYLVRADVVGAIVECGVWRGGSMMAVARTLREMNETSRNLYLFDTFEGMPPPSPKDVDAHGVPAARVFGETTGRPSAQASLPWQPEPVDGVRRAMQSTGYPPQLCHLVPGKVEDTVPAQAPEAIALLRLDTDWYESTKHEMVHLFPRIVPGGVLIVDDYGYWKGAKQAVDEYLESHGLNLLLTRIDDTCRLAVVAG